APLRLRKQISALLCLELEAISKPPFGPAKPLILKGLKGVLKPALITYNLELSSDRRLRMTRHCVAERREIIFVYKRGPCIHPSRHRRGRCRSPILEVVHGIVME